MSDLLVVLRRLERLEREMADLYRWYGRLFSGDPEAAELFRLLEQEEGSHESLVRFQRRVVERQPDRFGPVDVEVASIEAVLERLAGHRAGPAPDLGAAVAFAVGLEQSAGEQHARQVMTEVNSRLGELVMLLAHGDREHHARIVAFARSRGLPLPAPQPLG